MESDTAPEIHKHTMRAQPCFSKRLYRERNLIERFFSKLKHFRLVATRLRQACRQLPRHDPARLNTPVAPRLRVYDLRSAIRPPYIASTFQRPRSAGAAWYGHPTCLRPDARPGPTRG